jgi:hypothetical protein
METGDQTLAFDAVLRRAVEKLDSKDFVTTSSMTATSKVRMGVDVHPP